MSQDRALSCMRRAVIVSGLLITALYLLVAVSCVWAFGIDAGVTRKGNGFGNALYNFPPDNYPVTVFSVGICVAIILDYPIINFPLVSTVLRLNCRFMDWQYARHGLSIFFGAVVIMVDVAVPDLGDVFGLCGALGMSNFCYIVPGLVVLRKSRNSLARIIGCVAIAIGVGMLFVSTFFIVQGIVEKHQ